jgi:tetratricopeptide (TPR) repeat protein
MNLSWVLNRLRRTDEAIAKALEALELFERENSKEHIALCCNNIAVFYENKEELEKALEYNIRSLELFKELKNRRQIGNVELSLGYLRSKRGEMQMALEHFIRSADAMDRIGNLVGTATALLAKGRSYADMGRHEEAEISLISALNNFKEMGMDRRVVATLVSLISLLLDNKNTKDVYEYIEEAQEISKRNHFSSDEAKILRLQGRAYRIDDKEDESNEKYKASYEMFTELQREKDAQSVKEEWGA